MDPLQLQQMQTTQEMNSLDRVPRVPKELYSLSGALSIEESPYRNLYQKMSAEAMGEAKS